MKFKAKLVAGLGMALAILALIGVLSYRSILRGRQDVWWVTHTHQVLEQIDAVLAALTDAETGQRGFVVTGDESFLEPDRDAQARAQQGLSELHHLTADNPVQQRNLDRLEPLVAARFALLQGPIDLRRTSGFAAASQEIAKGDSKRSMDRVRAVLKEMTEEEDRLLMLRVKEADAGARRIVWVILLGNISGFLFLFLAGVVIYQEMAQRRRAEGEVRELNADLELRIAARTAELQERAKDLARSNSELQQFAYVASHDLQEPLRMVASFTQLLGKRYGDKLDDNAREFIHYAVDGANRLQTLITDLLSYSRVGTHAKPLQITQCDPLLDRVLNSLKLAIKDAGATITRDPLPVVMADEGQLGQLLQNLLTNAIKFRSEKPPLVHISAARDAAMWTVSVRDNGIGIAPEHAERIWVIFQRLHTKAEYPGTGIGLAICKKIAERHGGRIWVEASPGGGSTFSFTIPVLKGHESLEEKKQMNFEAPSFPVDILLVEDNAGDVRLTQEVLRDSKVRNNITVASNGEEALKCLRRQGKYKDSNRPDLILLDLNLPVKDGREVLAEIKEDEDLKRIPVVILTTSKAEEDILRTYNLHANCYITKPVDLDQFVNVVRSLEDFWLAVVMLPNHKL